MFGEFEALARMYHANPVFFTIALIGAMLFVPYQAVYGPIRNQYGRRIPRYRFPLFLGLLRWKPPGSSTVSGKCGTGEAAPLLMAVRCQCPMA